MNRSRADRESPARRGAVMFMVLATLAIVGLIAAAMLRHAILARRGLRGEHALRQVETLLDAAAARTRARIASGQPPTETLELGPADLGGERSALVVVTAEAAGDDAIRVRIVAEHPRAGPVPVRRTREFLVRAAYRPPTDDNAAQETRP